MNYTDMNFDPETATCNPEAIWAMDLILVCQKLSLHTRLHTVISGSKKEIFS